MQHKKEYPDREPHLPVLVCVVISFLLAAGCIVQDSQTDLEGTGWTLDNYRQNGTDVPVLAGTAVTLKVGEDRQLSGISGCNHYFASYETRGRTITITRIGSTEMYCTAPGVMEQEMAYHKLLAGARTYYSPYDRLVLFDENGTEILSYAKTVSPAPQPLTGTLWTLDSIHAAGSVSSVITGTTVTAVFTDGNITGSAGCNHYFARYTLTGESLMLSGTGSTKMICDGEGVMIQEQMYLGRLGKIRSYIITGNELALLDENGGRLLTFRTTI